MYSVKIDIAGKKFGNLTVIEFDYFDKKHGGSFWICKCECGNVISARGAHIKNGHTKSCGCTKKEVISKSKLNDLKGMTFGNLFVLERLENHISPKGQPTTRWLCRCLNDGNEIAVSAQKLVCGETTSCGCLTDSIMATKIKNYCREKYNTKIEYRVVKNPKNNYWLPYDIYLIDYKIFIEVQGDQHYKVNGWHRLKAKENGTTPEEELEYQKYKDKIKKKYAKKNGIYIEIDLRKIKTIEQAIEYIENIIKTLS